MGKYTFKVNITRIIVIFVCCLLLMIFCLSLFVPLSPTKSVIHTIGFLVTGRLHFSNKNIGKEVVDEKGNKFKIFREVIVDPSSNQPEKPGAILILHFRVENMTPEQNQRYSLLPILLYIGDPGFRSKLFTINGEYCQSIYEWDTVQNAENYLKSFAIKTISTRSVPGSFSYKIIKK